MKMRKELNNKGFSLVELLIATIILGIVVAPLLHTFVTAANTTARSRQMGDATLLSENMAEMVEATPLKDLDDLLSDPYFSGATDGTYNLDATTGVYSLSAKNVHAGSSAFNVKVTLDPSAYRAGGGINDVKISDYSNMDAIYAQSLDVDNPDALAWSAFQREADRRHEDGEWEASSVEPVRTMTLDITKDADDKINVVLQMDYTYSYLYNVFNEETGINDVYAGTISVDPLRYDLMSQGFSVATNGRLPNIYVMYYPLYESAGRINDIICINNMVDDVAQPFKIFLVKEETKSASGAVDPSLASKEYAYNATLEQYVPAGTPEENYAVVYSNIREDLVTGSNLGNKITYQIYRGNYFSVTGRFGGETPDKGGDLVSKSERNRLFDVKVDIYDAKDTAFATPIHTFYSTKLQ